MQASINIDSDHELLIKLEELRVLLNNSHCEKYKFFLDTSSYEENCAYAIQSKKLFILEQKEGILELIGEINDRENQKT